MCKHGSDMRAHQIYLRGKQKVHADNLDKKVNELYYNNNETFY